MAFSMALRVDLSHGAMRMVRASGTDTAARVSVSVELQNEQWLSDPTFAVNMGGGQEG